MGSLTLTNLLLIAVLASVFLLVGRLRLIKVEIVAVNMNLNILMRVFEPDDAKRLQMISEAVERMKQKWPGFERYVRR